MAVLARNGVIASEEGMMISERASSSLTVRNRDYVNEMKFYQRRRKYDEENYPHLTKKRTVFRKEQALDLNKSI